jgi:hypothetical protein
MGVNLSPKNLHASFTLGLGWASQPQLEPKPDNPKIPKTQKTQTHQIHSKMQKPNPTPLLKLDCKRLLRPDATII